MKSNTPDSHNSPSSDQPLVNGSYLLERSPGKGSWTYASIPEVLQNKNNPFGWVKVRGSIDGYPLEHYKLMPMGNGKLFLPVKAAIRKKIKKEAGNFVTIILYADETPLELPEEILACFDYERPGLREVFLNFTEGEQKAYLDWIYDAKTEDTKALRIADMMTRLEKGLRRHDSDPS